MEFGGQSEKLESDAYAEANALETTRDLYVANKQSLVKTITKIHSVGNDIVSVYTKRYKAFIFVRPN